MRLVNSQQLGLIQHRERLREINAQWSGERAPCGAEEQGNNMFKCKGADREAHAKAQF